ncbi:hypothetical protein XENTR_v10005471 [Xenopus tropicalis]|nr:hypothetical protein XENTR_v10005471 [Xenopus tropicalis]
MFTLFCYSPGPPVLGLLALPLFSSYQCGAAAPKTYLPAYKGAMVPRHSWCHTSTTIIIIPMRFHGLFCPFPFCIFIAPS